MTIRPDSTEYAPHYAKYVDLVADGDIVQTLDEQLEKIATLFGTITEERGSYAYAPGKWTIKELFGHVIDAERVFTYRAMRIARNDQTPLPGFEQDEFVANANFNARSLRSLTEEFTAVRRAGLQLFKHFTEVEWPRRGTASGKEVTVRALAYVIAGHAEYHAQILESRYM
jgi:hypothetical protein